jgi:hypothetical protein
MSNSELFKRLFDRAMVQENGCWEWASACTGRGYGVIKHKGHHLLAHRAAYDLCVADIPPSMYVCHRCDNPPCVNPEHLFLGTAQVNSDDCVVKGRIAQGERCNAVLTEDKVQEIRCLIDEGRWSQHEIARRFDVAQSTIWRIKFGLNWAWLPEVEEIVR